MPILPGLTVSDECACGRPGRPACQPGAYYGSIIPGWMVANPPHPAHMTDLQKKCLAEIQAIMERLKPANVIWEGADPLYVSVEKEWHDPAKRLALLERMASNPSQLRTFRPPTMPEGDFIRLWGARLRAYMDLLSRLALYDVVPEPATEDISLYFQR